MPDVRMCKATNRIIRCLVHEAICDRPAGHCKVCTLYRYTHNTYCTVMYVYVYELQRDWPTRNIGLCTEVWYVHAALTGLYTEVWYMRHWLEANMGLTCNFLVIASREVCSLHTNILWNIVLMWYNGLIDCLYRTVRMYVAIMSKDFAMHNILM